MQFILRASPRACTRIHIMWRMRYTECICAARRKYVYAYIGGEENWADRISYTQAGDKLHVAQAARDEWNPVEIQKS